MPKTQKNFYLLLSILLALSFGIKAFASLSLNTNNITSDGSLTLTNSSGILTLPTTLGTSGQFLQTNGAGVTSWATVTSGTGTGGTWGSITGTLSSQTDLQSALDAKQTTLAFTPENIANKATDFSIVNNALYPTVQATKTYADSLVAGLLDYRGGYDASSNTYPTTGGSGNGTILKGDTFIISGAGTLGGNPIQVGDSIIANIDNPGSTSSNWNTLNTNISYVPENSAGRVTTISGGSLDTQYPSAKLLFDQLALKQAVGSYQSPISLTTTGTSGPATFVGNTLNIPQYTGGTTATNLAGGLGGSIPYQSSAGTTAMLANGIAGQVLTSAGTTLAPTWSTLTGGTPGGSAGQVQVNTAGAFAGQPFAFSGGGSAVFQRAIECAKGIISISAGNWTTPGGTVAAAAAAIQDIPIITGLNGDQRYSRVMVSEATIFSSASVTATKISIGRPGASTDDEMLPQTNFMQSSGNNWFAEDRPQTPILGSANTYNLVLAVRTTGGNVSALTGGAVNYEVCGYKSQ